MKIGMIGAGNIGGTVGKLWIDAGHELFFGSRHPEALSGLLAKLGSNAQVGSVEEAAAFGTLLFCSAPYGAWPELALKISEFVSGKIVIDAANPYPERDGEFATTVIAAGEGSGLPVARLMPDAHLVRAFNSVYFETLANEAHRADPKIGIPLASDDNKALESVSMLVRDAGFEPVNVGALIRAKDFDPDTSVYNTGMTAAEIEAALL